MSWLRRANSEPLWKEEFSVHAADERYVTRRQLTKFLVLTSFGMFVGNIWILVRSLFYKTPWYPQQPVARLGEIPVGGVKLFTYPTKEDQCIMVRTGENEYGSSTLASIPSITSSACSYKEFASATRPRRAFKSASIVKLRGT